MPVTGRGKKALLLLAYLMFLDDDNFESPLHRALQTADYNDVADNLDGTKRDGKTVPHAERYWERRGRYLSNARFKSAFRCRCGADWTDWPLLAFRTAQLTLTVFDHHLLAPCGSRPRLLPIWAYLVLMRARGM